MTKHGIKDQLWQQKYQVIQTKTLQIVTFTHLRGRLREDVVFIYSAFELQECIINLLVMGIDPHLSTTLTNTQ